MNERIRELAEDAELDWHTHWNDDESNRLEKFAQLIVAECAKDFDKTYMTGGETVGNYIRRKFGIE